ncbi:MAG: hypothetical protein UT15_C0003G0032 [Berkelbacteria bacterium GW2011_GWA1_39_10]|uniref:Uncharacterized protein n=1 Tax=Berkelbacteria bacterium GW2011_GWA1_39_10 TaxID=1618332 RepID=A0A0G0LIF8_9BACT|nr:MAG: hypothetical protein UT15_C0003G0032 [Berkelbacteria bacterium GW2011_GWA1_39_10]
MNALQKALLEVGLANQDQLPSETFERRPWGSWLPNDISATVRLYLPDRSLIPEGAEELVTDRLENMCVRVGPGMDVLQVTSVVAAFPDPRCWIEVVCNSSLTAGSVMELLRLEDFPAALQVQRITTPGIRA